MAVLPIRPQGSHRPRVRKVSELVARQIVQDIVDKDLPAGSLLPGEAVMLHLYQVSRSSLREALRILESNGLITVRPGPGGGPLVSTVDPAHFGSTTSLFLQMGRTRFSELIEARMVIEPLMAKLAAERRDPGRLAELERCLEQHRTLDAENDPAGYLSVTQDFHGVIAGLSGNGVLDLFGRALKEIFTDRVLTSHQPASRWEEVKEEHEAIAGAILDGDAGLAEELMRVHMHEFVESFRKRYLPLFDEIIGWG